MTRFLTGAAAAGAFLLSSIIVHAADLPNYKAPAYTSPAGYSWTGFYVGANVGYARSSADFTTTADPGGHLITASLPTVNAAGTGSANASGFTGGVQLGYNWQWNKVVLGVEGDFNILSGTATFNGSGVTPSGTALTMSNSLKPKWMATVRPRIGYAFDRFMVYGTGGAAMLRREYTQTYSDSLTGAANLSTADTKIGWVVGAGLEWAVFERWSVKGEYLYSKFGDITTNGALVAAGAGNQNGLHGTANTIVQSLRFGVNYRF